MQTVSAEFITATSAVVRQIVSTLSVCWDGVNWVDETANLVGHSGAQRLAALGEDLIAPGDVGTATVVLRNAGRRYSWLNTAGALYAYIGGDTGLFGKGVKIAQGFYVGDPLAAELVVIFTGVIYDWQDNPATETVTLNLRDIGFKYLQNRASCLVQADLRADEALAYYANMVGIGSGDRVLDIAAYRIPWTWLDDESILEELWQIATSVGGFCYFDELGKLRFHVQTHWASITNPTWTLDFGDYKTFKLAYGIDTLASKVIVEWSARYASLATIVYTLNEAKLVRPGETLTFEARFSNPLYSYLELVATNDYKIISATGVDIGTSVTVSLPSNKRYAQRCTVSVVNNHTTLAAEVIFLQIRGYPLIGGPVEQAIAELSPAPTWPIRTRSVRGNMYVQTQTQAEALTQFLLARYRELNPLWTLTDVRGVPQLELGDRIRWSGPTNAPVPFAARDGYVTGIEWTYSNQVGFTQTLTVLDASNLFAYSNYFIIGTTALGQHGRAWY